MFGGRIYTLSWDAATAVTASIDIFEVDPAADKGVFIHEIKVWQTTDLGDAAEEVIPISVRRGYTTSGSSGGTTTVGKKYAGDSTNGFATECRNTGLATTGTPDILMMDGWNVRVPFLWTPVPPHLLPYSPNPIMVVRLDAAPADSITMNASIVVEEIG